MSMSGFDDLEQRRGELQHTLDQLEKSLRHWRTWEAEYEGFQDELQAVGPDPSPARIEEIAADFGGEVFTEAECSSLIKDKDGTPRKASKILDLMRHRLDWFRQNVQQLEKQLDATGAKVTALDAIVSSQPRDEEGLPLQEIHEELDEDDNVISGSVSNHKDGQDMLTILKEKGLKGLPSFPESITSSSSSTFVSGSQRQDTTSFKKLESSDSKSSEKPVQKSVRFADATPEATTATHHPSNPSTDLKNTSAVHQDVERSLTSEFAKGQHFPSNESPAEVALRREMMEYNLSDPTAFAGAIVAEMDMMTDDSASELSTDGDDEDESEDEFGRTTMPVITDEYRQQMLEMEQRLNAKYGQRDEPGAHPKPTNLPVDENVSMTSQVSPDQDPSSPAQKKGVRFAQNIDIRSPPASPQHDSVRQNETEAAMLETVVERDISGDPASEPPIVKPPSRFMASRTKPRATTNKSQIPSNQGHIASGPLAGMDTSALIAVQGSKLPATIAFEPEERGPQGKTHTDTLIENANVDSSKVEEPDEYSPDLVHRQISDEYNKRRNRLIQRNGGFKSDEEDGFYEDKPKMSRFMAARVSSIKK